MAAPQIVWFRNDLRLADQAAVRAAAAAGPVVAVYVLDDATPGKWRPGAAKRWWLHYSLTALARDLKHMGGQLILRRGRPAVELAAVAKATGAKAVHALHHYEPWAIGEEAAVAQALELTLHDGAYLAPPGTTRSGSGTPYRIFTPYWNALQEVMPPGDPEPAPMVRFADAPPGDDLDDWKLSPRDPDWAGGFDVWTPGEAGAHAALDAFAEVAGDYDHGRNFPARPLTSRLSPHLHHGEISPAQVWAVINGGGAGASTYRREIGWRDFGINLVLQFPRIGDEPNRLQFDAFPFRDDPAGLAAWRRGQTGYPIVDAGMRQLRATGWMHNRVRMIVASFLTKHLLIDWRRGERWFWDCLVDADYGNNSLGWQWIMGSGVDSSPFNRIFTPVGQSEKFDAGGVYIREWVRELAKLPNDAIHAPWTAPPGVLAAAGVVLGTTYPHPIVDHAAARARALAAYATIKSPAVPSAHQSR